MKPARELEPGVLSTFRLFIGVQFIVSIFITVAHGSTFYPPRFGMAVLSMFSVLASGPLLIYLSLPNLQHFLKSFYLPIGIVWASIWSILEPYLVLHTIDVRAQAIFELALWQQIIVLFIPLIVISWQYEMPQVILFCGLTGVSNIVLLSWSHVELTHTTFSETPLGIIFIEVVALLLVGHMVGHLLSVQREQRQSLTEANQRLAQYASTLEQLTISRERNRLARELHDVLAHTLSGVAVELEGLRTMLSRDPEQAKALLSNSLRAIREGLTETRRALQELRAQPLEDLGLALAVRSLAESYASRANFKIELKIDSNLGDYPDQVQQCIYRIAQEALANVANHARAQNVKVVLERAGDQLQLIVKDDGGGFNPDDPVNEHQYGLRGMHERAEMIGGVISVESRVGVGTQVAFTYKAGS